ncbi:DsbE family thiol:disulfide interchange protein [Aureimonas frigidaquae]|uniref:DsbE family thiol:disulfide interchange protein n=1 Tax=Aureimonas frigidaquae TaxID=424757 RepID=UPI000780ABD4|nr:DsbE family thiol:disulfide interchange protein [Aureimonas frigidaquae]
MSQEPQRPRSVRRRLGLAALPLVAFIAIGAVFLMALESGRDPQALPSALQGRAAPATTLAPLAGLARIDGTPTPGLSLPQGGTGRMVLVNVFASWCAPCRQEHPLLMQLARDERFDLVGINYKDKVDNAQAFLRELGNPYEAIGLDTDGRASIDWGVYGVPETYLVSPDGIVLWKATGPLTPEIVTRDLLPRLDKGAPDGTS